MELAFLVSALRRYAWVVILCAFIGTIPGLLTFTGGQEQFESRTVLLITPPTEAGTVASGVGDDRYIAGEISIMASLADTVASEVDGVSEGELEQWVSFEQQPLTNVVVVIAKAPTAELAQEIAGAYSTAYFDVLSTQLSTSLDPAISAVDEELDEVREQLRTVDQQLGQVLGSFSARGIAASPEQVAPSLSSDKELLLARFNELTARRSELNTGLEVSSRVLREPSLPTLPLSSSSRLLVVAGGIAGAFVGLVLALIAARLSRRVLDDEQVAEVLGHPVVGKMPVRPELLADKHAMLREVDSDAERFIDTLGVRVEASGGAMTTTVLVSGVSARTGTTTMAASLARQLALSGSLVLLVDADRRHPELIQMLGEGPITVQGAVADSVTSLYLCDLANLGPVVDTGRSPSTRRRDLGEIFSAVHAGVDFDVIVFDGGPLMDAASTVTLGRLVDVVVLTMPERLSIRALTAVSNELSAHEHLLPIWVPSVSGKERKRLSQRFVSSSKRSADPSPGFPPMAEQWATMQGHPKENQLTGEGSAQDTFVKGT